MPRALARLLAVGLVASCTRAPSEEFPAHPVPEASLVAPAAQNASLPAPASPSAGASAPTTTSVAPPGRCVRATPATPPPPVAPGPAAGCPVDPEGGPPKVPVVHVGFADPATKVEAELVSNEHDTTRGLMYRKSMPEDHGMLFDLHVREDHQFWMHNTCIPLDLLYIDGDGLLVGIVENAPTLDDGTRGVHCPSRYVLEVNAGWSRRHGVKAGQRVVLP